MENAFAFKGGNKEMSEESFWKLLFTIMVVFLFCLEFGVYAPLRDNFAECSKYDKEYFAKELEDDLLFYHDLNQGLHFLDKDGCEWKIVIEPATAYVDCREQSKGETK